MKTAALFTACVSLAGSHLASATVTLSFSNPVTGALTNLADSSGSNANGLWWGIVVDAAGNGFDASTTFGPGAGLQLATNRSGVALGDSDDVFFFEADFPTVTTPGSGQGGPGSVTTLTSLVLNAGLGVNAGDLFAIVWFDRGFVPGSTADSGTRWGFYENPGLVMPPDGYNEPYYSLFLGPDPVRSVPAAGSGPEPVAAPEPSATLLGLGSALLLWRRRRR
jgi:hypothetical protein